MNRSFSYEELTLADAIEEEQQYSEDQDYSALGVSTIGILPLHFSSILSLNISNNCIYSLEGLEVLFSLESLNLSYNDLSTLQSIEPLKSLRTLFHLNISQNPVSDYPLTRAYLGYHIQTLLLLDNSKITDLERESPDISRYVRLTESITRNESDLIRLENLKLKLKLHREMIVHNYLERYKGVNVRTFLKVFPCHSDWEAEIKEWTFIRVNELHELLQDQEQAWKDSISVQMDRIHVFSNTCESLAKECKALFEGIDPMNNSGFNTKRSDIVRTEDTESSGPYNRVIPNRMSVIDERLLYFRNKNSIAMAIHNTIKEGLSTVVDRFKRLKTLKFAFKHFQIGTETTKKYRQIHEKIVKIQVKFAYRQIVSIKHQECTDLREVLLRKFICRWKTYVRIDRKNEDTLSLSFFAWKMWINKIAIPKREKLLLTQALYEQNVYSKVFSALKLMKKVQDLRTRVEKRKKTFCLQIWLYKFKNKQHRRRLKLKLIQYMNLRNNKKIKKKVFSYLKSLATVKRYRVMACESSKHLLLKYSSKPILRENIKHSPKYTSPCLTNRDHNKIDRLDKFISMRTKGNELIQDINKKLDRIESRLHLRNK